MIYLYSYTDQPWKGQYHVREVLDRLYHSGPDGYCGDEDNGQTSAWYVFSSLGFYPVTPGADEYIKGSPLFNKITLTMEYRKQFIINAANNSKENVYIDNVTVNGKSYDKNYITHSTFQNGGMIEFIMSSTPNKKRGRLKASQPYSMLDDDSK